MTRTLLVAAAAAALVATGVLAQGMHDMHGKMTGPGMGQGHDGHDSAAQAKGDQSPSSLALAAVNAKMHGAMDIPYTGNADRDFVAGMIPHHEGAVDMAKVVLAFGKDPEVRKLAEAIIKAQETEISWMKAWQSKQGK
jgi:uncharacterized protein (DUF305 family)